MTNNPVRWFEIYVEDLTRAKKFYEAVFQVKLEPLTNPADDGLELWSFPMSKEGMGCGGALVKMKGVSSGGNSTIVYFGCADCAIEEARVVKAGGRVEKAKMSIGQYGYIALVYDTEGNMLGLHSIE